MESWQALQSWFLFIAVAGGLAWYYSPATKKVTRQAPAAKEAKEKVKKTLRKPEAEKTASASIVVEDSDVAANNGTKKRKANAQGPIPSFDQTANVEEIDMSTHQFAKSMTQARQGIQMKSDNKSKQRVKTVKTGTPLLSSGSSQVDGEDDWSPVASPAPRAGAIDDMLEPTAAGPTSLRITAPEQPVKEKTPKQQKKVEVETKKQRQNRKKVEEKKAEREAEEALQNQRKENQRRTAREARGEPAKNGIASPAPLNNPWAEKNAARDAQLPVHTSDGGNAQLLDTFETESNSSSNQEVSTAATSTTDAPSRWADDLASGEDDYAKALQESERETGWSEVKSNKKLKKKNTQAEANGASTPVVKKTNTATNNSRFGALNDEAERSASTGVADPSNWAT